MFLKSRVLQISRLKNAGWEARDYYDKALMLIVNISDNDYIKISLNYANFLYQIEWSCNHRINSICLEEIIILIFFEILVFRTSLNSIIGMHEYACAEILFLTF